MLEHCLLDMPHGEVLVGTVSALSCVQHKVQVPKGAVSSACSWDRQTGQPGGVELATCSPTKERFMG